MSLRAVRKEKSKGGSNDNQGNKCGKGGKIYSRKKNEEPWGGMKSKKREERKKMIGAANVKQGAI